MRRTISGTLKTTGTDGKRIGVRSFRLLYQWPLFVVPKDGKTDLTAIMDCVNATKKKLEGENSGWSAIDPLDYPDLAPKTDTQTDSHTGLSPAYGEFLYFHDFVQKFLFPRRPDKDPKSGNSPVFTLFKSNRFESMKCEINEKLTIDFKIERHSLHLFSSGIAMVSLELVASCKTDGPGHKTTLSLADVMIAMDLVRRSYVPYFDKDTGKAGGVAKKITLIGKDNVESTSPTEKQAHEFLLKKNLDIPQCRPTMLGHWTTLAKPLELLGSGGNWRDLSDERLPFNAYISLTNHSFHEKTKAEIAQSSPGHRQAYKDEKKQADATDDRNALLQICDGDWLRLAEVDPPGDVPFVYNPEFLEHLKEHAFYDRFYPHPQTGGNACRHIFSAAHYCAVGAGDSFDGFIAGHWRRHYAALTLIARFEQASLLAISSRISQIAHDYDPQGGQDADQKYEAALLDVQKQFSLFEHRFRFTGVSSQIQGREMFDRLRGAAMGLDVLYDDVKNEIEQAGAQVMALQQTRAADAAGRLNQLATIGVFLALVVSVAGLTPFVNTDCGFGPAGIISDQIWRFSFVVAVSALVFLVALWIIPQKKDKFLCNFRIMLMSVALLSIATFVVLSLFC